jgi:flavorubredoxin
MHTDTTTPTGPAAAGPDKPRHLPVEIAPETWVIQDTMGEGGPAPMAVHMNSLLIRGAEPIVVDTGVPDNRDRYFEDLFGLVDPHDVRWVFISHDDVDHYGNVNELLAACPNATLVASWFLCERLGTQLEVPPFRWRWLGDGETLDAGDRTLAAIRPPLYDSPTTRGLFDARTGVYWASDCYATPVERGTAFVEDLDPEEWAGGFNTFARWNSPWVDLVDPDRFAAECRRIEELPLHAIAGTHGPTIEASDLAQAHALLRDAPRAVVPPQPGQDVLDEIVASMTAPAA